jgi:hypothetical protein
VNLPQTKQLEHLSDLRAHLIDTLNPNDKQHLLYGWYIEVFLCLSLLPILNEVRLHLSVLGVVLGRLLFCLRCKVQCVLGCLLALFRALAFSCSDAFSCFLNLGWDLGGLLLNH